MIETTDLLRSFAFQFIGVTIGAAVVMILLLMAHAYVFKNGPSFLRALAGMAGAVMVVFAILAVIVGGAVTS